MSSETWRFRRVFFILMVWIQGCVTARLSEVESAPDFGWDALKRDWILMSPLLDLREDPTAPSGSQEALAFFTDKERVVYAEAFKQKFLKWRKDIRLFGAGGAFDHLSGLDGLPALARKVFAKKPLPDETVRKIRDGSQDLRFILFFAITAENLAYDVSYRFRADRQTDLIVYQTTRHFTVRMALWDSHENETVWLGTKYLAPSDASSVEVVNPNKVKRVKRRKGKKDLVYWEGLPLPVNLDEELRDHRGRFPGFSGREPALSGSFDDFTLSLPINPEEEKLIIYNHFVYHRPHFGLVNGRIGSQGSLAAELGLSSAINFRYRLGAVVQIPVASPRFAWDGGEREIDGVGFGLTFDLEWPLSDRLHLLTGLMAGGVGFDISDPNELERDANDLGDSEKSSSIESDFASLLAPRVRLLAGAKQGIQWGGGVSYRQFYGIEKEILKIHEPSSWTVDLMIAYAFRGF